MKRDNITKRYTIVPLRSTGLAEAHRLIPRSRRLRRRESRS